MPSTDNNQLIPADDAAIRAVESAYDSAWNAGDAASAARLFVEGAVIINPFGGVSAGRNDIERLLGEVLSGRGRGSTHTSRLLSINSVTDDVIVVDGEAIIAGFGSEPSPLQHRFTDILVRRNGEWRFAHVRAYVFMPTQALQ